MSPKCKVNVGDVFGKLTVTKVVSKPDPKGSTRRKFVATKCECGSTKEDIRPTDLTRGHVTSCGCQQRRANGLSLTNEYALWHRAKKRAESNSVPFNIELQDIRIPDVCPLLEIPLFRAKGKASGPCDNSPTLDRIKPHLGYIQGNIWVISALANRIKSDATPNQISLLATNLLCLQNFSVGL